MTHRDYDAIAFDRLFDRAMVRETGCFEFVGAMSDDGYGRIFYRGRNIKTHRLAYLLCVGDIPNGLHVLHDCDNRICVNPDHLFLGTNEDNVTDMVAKGRQSRKGGNCILVPSEVERVKSLLSEGRSASSIAKMFSVSKSCVKHIRRGRTWTNL